MTIATKAVQSPDALPASKQPVRPRILAVIGVYLPGYKAGGPIHSLSNLVAALGGEEFEFHVLTRDRDHTDTVPYTGVDRETWVQVGNARVFYTANLSLRHLRRRVLEANPDILYLNGFFSGFTIRILLLRRLGLLPPVPVVLAPRGEFSPGALALKRIKKAGFMAVASAIGLYRNILWQACAKKEASEIQAAFKVFPMATAQTRADGVQISEASNIPAAPSAASDAHKPVEKFAGKVSFVFVSRVSPKKNVKAAIEMVSSLQGEVAFDIFGPVDDSEYWEQCSKLLAQSPANVKIRYLGPLQHAEVGKTFSQYHFFLFPTLGENFGHVIVESLGSGCPVIVSDRTPWNGLDRKNVGWDLPLNEPGSWHRVLQDCVDMNSETYQNMSKASVQFVRSWLNSAKIIDDNIAMFQRALSLNSNK